MDLYACLLLVCSFVLKSKSSNDNILIRVSTIKFKYYKSLKLCIRNCMGSITLIRFIRPTMLMLAFPLKRESVNRKSAGKLFSKNPCMISTVVRITCERSETIPNAKCMCGGYTLYVLWLLCMWHSTKWGERGKSFTYIKPQRSTILILWNKWKRRWAVPHSAKCCLTLNVSFYRIVMSPLDCIIFMELMLWCTDDFFRSVGIKLFSIFIWTSIKRRNKMSILNGIIWWMTGLDVSSLSSCHVIHSMWK